jgi:uncharacterized protein (PEP-CTERM system associated)
MLALLTMAPETLAQTRAWSITPSIGVRGTYTDNVSLVATPENGEFVTQVSPGIAINGRGRRFNASLAYTADLFFYARNSDENRLANTLSAAGNLEAIENFFFVDASASVSQNYISPFGLRPTDIFSLTDNRAETRTFSLSPYIRGQFADGASYEVRNRNTWTSADTGALADIHTRQWSASIQSAIRLFGVGVDAADNRTSFENGVERPDQEMRHVRGKLFFQPDSTLRLFASAGREENNFALLEDRSYRTYGYGALWQPTPRTTAELNWEHRFFGTARLARFSHRMRLTAFNASYSRDVSNSQQEFLRLPPGNTAVLLDQILLARIPDPVERQAAVRQFLNLTGTPAFLANSVAFYTEQVLLQEHLQGSMAIIGTRNSVAFTAFASRSTALTENASALPTEIFLAAGHRVKQHGFGANASHRLTGSTSLVANANRTFAESEQLAVLESRTDTLGLSLSHTLSPKTITFAGASYTKAQPAGVPASHARSVFAGLNHRF